MFSRSQRFYDAIYAHKNYQREAEQLIRLINLYKRGKVETLLDAGCGTGAHLSFLKDHFTAEGLDLDPGMIEIARSRNPGTLFHLGDMVSFDLGRRFDVVTSLFSAIGYVVTAGRLEQAVERMSRHVVPGGLLIIEPFFGPDDWVPGRHVQALFVDEPDLKIARLTIPERDGSQVQFEFHYLIGTPEGIDHFVERHQIGLFTHEDYLQAFQRVEFEVMYDEDWPTRRGLYVGIAPSW